ncbi:MAG: hypothetical protein KDD84_23685, partial [Caldilineaceae bacterium]|nr:hypothetical protein [Caldilineaceae bacterium]
AALETKHDADLSAMKERFLRLREDHLARQRRHNRGLHTVGVLHKIPSADEQASEFSVRANGGMSVTVWPGAAIDAAGNEIFLDAPLTLAVQPTEQDKRVYVVVSYVDHFAAYIEDLTQPFTNQARTAQCQVTDVPPDNETWLALAQIDLAAGVSEIREPVDPVNPQPNEIDRRVRVFSGAVSVQPTYLDPPVQRHLVQTMLATRHHFAALTRRFPTPSLDDVRYGAVHLQMTATSVDRGGVFNALNGLSLIEETTESELAQRYPALIDEDATMGYKGAINELRQTLLQKQDLDTVLTAQQAVAEAALLLSEVVFPPPVAVAGADQQVTTPDAEAKVTLDGSGSEAGPGRKIVNYRWDVV